MVYDTLRFRSARTASRPCRLQTASSLGASQVARFFWLAYRFLHCWKSRDCYLRIGLLLSPLACPLEVQMASSLGGSQRARFLYISCGLRSRWKARALASGKSIRCYSHRTHLESDNTRVTRRLISSFAHSIISPCIILHLQDLISNFATDCRTGPFSEVHRDMLCEG